MLWDCGRKKGGAGENPHKQITHRTALECISRWDQISNFIFEIVGCCSLRAELRNKRGKPYIISCLFDLSLKPETLFEGGSNGLHGSHSTSTRFTFKYKGE